MIAFPYPEVNETLRLLLAGVQSVLGSRLVGLYLGGSLAAGDFTPHRSDIDFLAVTDGPLSPATQAGLAAMHVRLAAGGLEWARKMEGSYVPASALRRYNPQDARFPALRSDGSFAVDGHGPDWIIQCHVLREKGIALCGPHIQSLIDPVEPDELRQATAGTLREWWAPVLDVDQARLESAEYRAYAVLTMCRGLYTLAHGAVASKTAAARWAQSGPARPWTEIIEHALAWREGMPMDPLPGILELVALTLKAADEYPAAKADGESANPSPPAS
jgi:hypothetical protein